MVQDFKKYNDLMEQALKLLDNYNQVTVTKSLFKLLNFLEEITKLPVVGCDFYCLENNWEKYPHFVIEIPFVPVDLNNKIREKYNNLIDVTFLLEYYQKNFLNQNLCNFEIYFKFSSYYPNQVDIQFTGSYYSNIAKFEKRTLFISNVFSLKSNEKILPPVFAFYKANAFDERKNKTTIKLSEKTKIELIKEFLSILKNIGTYEFIITKEEIIKNNYEKRLDNYIFITLNNIYSQLQDFKDTCDFIIDFATFILQESTLNILKNLKNNMESELLNTKKDLPVE